MEKVRTAIIGTGKVAELHAQALKDAPSSEFRAVWNRTHERAVEFAGRHRVKAYREIEQMVRDERIQAVAVCTTHPAHAEPAIAALKAGAHVIIDKPLASSLEDCDRMLEAAKHYGRKLAMISQRRLYSPVQRIRKAIDDGKLGVPMIGIVTMLGWRDKKYYDSDSWRGTWRLEGGGVLVNQAPHQLDILQWLMGPIDSVYGVAQNINHPYIEVEDTAVATIRFKNGALGSIVVSNSQNPALYGKVHIFGSNGASAGVQTDGGQMFIAGMSKVTEAPYNDIWTIPGEENLRETWKKEDEALFNSIDATTYFHKLQIQDFCEAIVNNREPLVTGEEGRKTVELFTAVYRSTRDGKPVNFPLEAEAERSDFDGRLNLLSALQS